VGIANSVQLKIELDSTASLSPESFDHGEDFMLSTHNLLADDLHTDGHILIFRAYQPLSCSLLIHHRCIEVLWQARAPRRDTLAYQTVPLWGQGGYDDDDDDDDEVNGSTLYGNLVAGTRFAYDEDDDGDGDTIDISDFCVVTYV